MENSRGKRKENKKKHMKKSAENATQLMHMKSKICVPHLAYDGCGPTTR
jgi:hypothetical protein